MPKGRILVKQWKQPHIRGSMPNDYVFSTNAMCLEGLGWMKEILNNMRAQWTPDGGMFLLIGKIGNSTLSVYRHS